MTRMQVWICREFWNPEFARTYSDRLFIFGDNEAGWGTKGQACIRGEQNAIGIPTQKRPARTNDGYWNDREYDRNCRIIDAAIAIAIKRLRERDDDGNRLFRGVVFPKDGLGTGLAGLPWRAPKTLLYLNRAIRGFQKAVFKIKQ